jgi:hypothetical protein
VWECEEESKDESREEEDSNQEGDAQVRSVFASQANHSTTLEKGQLL